MKTKAFVRKFEFATWDDVELAERLVAHLDDGETLKGVAQKFLDARRALDAALDAVGFERG